MQRERLTEKLTRGYHETTPSDWELHIIGYICRELHKSLGDREE
jgi:hypothetical protein